MTENPHQHLQVCVHVRVCVCWFERSDDAEIKSAGDRLLMRLSGEEEATRSCSAVK